MKILSSTHQHPSYDPLLSAVDAAAYLNLHPETLKKLARLRQIACVRNSKKKGSTVSFRLSALNAWVKKHEVRPLRNAFETSCSE